MDAVLPHSIVMQTDGRIIVAGNFYHGAESIRRQNIVRLKPDGSHDASFDVGAGADGEVWRVLLEPDGQILISGYFSSFNGVPRQGIARLNNDVVLSFVTRQLPYQEGTTVRLVAQPSSSVAAYAVQDQPPAGWVINNISHGGVFDRVSGKVKFGPFFDAEPRTLSYDALPPIWGVHGVLGVFSFCGEASADGVNTPITGDQYLTIASLFPADLTPADSQLDIAEVTAYGAAWRQGAHWPVNPSPIPINYVTRAAALWRGGECYTVDRAITIEPLWWVNCPTGAVHAPNHGAPSLAKSCPAVRQVQPVFVPGDSITVTITVSPAAGVSAFAAEEQVPPGWTVSNFSHGGQLDAVNGRVKWGPFLDPTPRSLSYQAVPPADVQTGILFTGLASYDGVATPIGGDSQSRPGCRLAAHYLVQQAALQLSLTGLVGARFQIEASSDLVNWVSLTTVTNNQGSVQLPAAGTAAWPQRFYRARLLE